MKNPHQLAAEVGELVALQLTLEQGGAIDMRMRKLIQGLVRDSLEDTRGQLAACL